MASNYTQTYDHLLLALHHAPGAQLELLAATDAAFAFMNEADESLSDEEVLGLRVLLGQAQTILGRYFGM
jgi:hypothetical protein